MSSQLHFIYSRRVGDIWERDGKILASGEGVDMLAIARLGVAIQS